MHGAVLASQDNAGGLRPRAHARATGSGCWSHRGHIASLVLMVAPGLLFLSASSAAGRCTGGAPHMRAPRLPRASSLRLRGGSYLDDVEPLEFGLGAREIDHLHYDIGKDGAQPAPPDHSRRVGNLSFFDEAGHLDEQGATDGFPFDWTKWRPDARFHVGFRAPTTLALNRSIYSTFEKGELVVVPRSDGSHRFAQVTERKSEGYFRGEMQVGHQYTVLLEPRSPGALPVEKILDSEQIGKPLLTGGDGQGGLDAACRLEAARKLREMGNGALNSSRLEEASRKYVKALAYLDGLPVGGASGLSAGAEGADSAVVDEWIKVQLNLALVHLRSRQFHECVADCSAVLQVRPNETKALYRCGLALKKLGRRREASQRLKEAFRHRPGDILLRKELSGCFDNFTAFLDEINPILTSLPPEKLREIKDHAVGPDGRPMLADVQAAPPGWVTAREAEAMSPHSDGNANNTRAATLLHRLAEVDQLPDAQFNLGCYYSEGKGVARDHAQARKWFRRAAAQGHVRAQVNLAIQYTDGVGGARNESEGAVWFGRAAAGGDSRAARMLGVMHAEGRGVAKNLSAAAGWYHRAARSNDTKAQFNLGVCFQEGLGVPKDAHKAAKWCSLSLSLSLSLCMYVRMY